MSGSANARGPSSMVQMGLAITVCLIGAAVDSIYRGIKQLVFPGLVGTTPHILFDACVTVVAVSIGLYLYVLVTRGPKARLAFDEAELDQILSELMSHAAQTRGSKGAMMTTRGYNDEEAVQLLRLLEQKARALRN